MPVESTHTRSGARPGMTSTRPSSKTIQTAAAMDLIETIRIDADGRMLLLDRHLDRLRASCMALGRAWDADEVRAALLAAAHRADGPGPHRLRLLHHADGTLTPRTTPLPALPAPQGVMPMDDAPVVQRIAVAPQDHVSSLVRPHYGMAGRASGHLRRLVLQRTRRTVRRQPHERLSANGWHLVHAPVACGCLPGVQRAALLDAGLVQERILYADDVSRAARIRLSNALRGWMDVELRLGAKA